MMCYYLNVRFQGQRFNQTSRATQLSQELYLTDVSCSEIENDSFLFTQLCTFLPQIQSKDGEYPVS